MGNVTIKEGEDVEVDEKHIYSASLATESENLSSSVISEDAISLTTDSTATTATEYESANENDNYSNRVSSTSTTDVWYDYSSTSVKSLSLTANETSAANHLEDLSAVLENTSNEVSRLINGICENSSSGFFVAVPEKCCNHPYDRSTLQQFHSNDVKNTEMFHDLSTSFVEDVVIAGAPNLVVRERSRNDDEFVKENYDLIRKWHRRAARSGNGDIKRYSYERAVGIKKPAYKRKSSRRCASNKDHRYLRGSTYVTCKFKAADEEPPTILEKKQHHDYNATAEALAKAVNQVSFLLKTSAYAGFDDKYEQNVVSYVDDLTNAEFIVRWNTKIIKLLNDRLEYAAVFQFNYYNVFVSYDDDDTSKNYRKLRETFVRSFLSQDSYCQHLDGVVFRIKCVSNNLNYTVEIPSSNIIQDIDGFVVDNLMVNFNEVSTETNFVPKIDANFTSHNSPSSGFVQPQHFNNDHAIARPIMNCSKENISEAGPATAADIDNINNVPFLNDSSELDFISRAGGTGLVAETLRKQSLYVKFDPLVASAEVNSTLNDNTLKLDDSLVANNTLTAAVNNIKLDTSQENNNTSAEVTTDSLKLNESSVGKLISVTPNKSPRKVTPKSSPRYTDIDPDDVSKLQSLLLKQMKREEAFKEEIESLKLDNEQVLKKLQNSEQEINNLKSVLEAVQENEKKLKNELMERIKSKQQLSLIMEEYEKTMSQMVSKRDEEKKEHEAKLIKIEAERDNTLQHLNNLENAFNDIHQKYERGKAVNEALKKNEDLLKKSLNEYEQTVKTVENKYELLKSHATSQLEKANQELELITQSYEKEQAKMKAMLKKSEIQISSLQNALERKSKENQELTAICDELIVKLSTHSNS